MSLGCQTAVFHRRLRVNVEAVGPWPEPVNLPLDPDARAGLREIDVAHDLAVVPRGGQVDPRGQRRRRPGSNGVGDRELLGGSADLALVLLERVVFVRRPIVSRVPFESCQR